MFASIYRFTRGPGAKVDVLRALRQLAAALSQRPGFVSYALLEAAGHVGLSVTVFETRADLLSANRYAEAWAAEHLPGWSASPEQIATGEIIVQQGM
jgi:heme-degrading monooxygenase HmoA